MVCGSAGAVGLVGRVGLLLLRTKPALQPRAETNKYGKGVEVFMAGTGGVKKAAQLPALQYYKLHAPGRRAITGRLQRTGTSMGGGTHTTTQGALIKTSRGRTKGRAEKTFLDEPANITGILSSRIVFMLNKMKKLNLSVIPSARLAMLEGVPREERHKYARLIMTDLTKGGRFKVLDYRPKGEEKNWKLKGLKNREDIERQIKAEEEIAEKNGFHFRRSEWLIIVDPKTMTGRPCIVDVKFTNMNEKLEKEWRGWCRKLGLI